MNPSDIGEAYNQITHLWESENFNRLNGIEQHERAIAFVKSRAKHLMLGVAARGALSIFS